jgi:tRNA dimethylallyltransferase
MVQPIPTSKVFIIAGPTASGKSDYAVELARLVSGEIVNADSAQMYTRVSIGTAKPSDWASHEIAHHLFDICDQPVNFDVVQYRSLIIETVADINSRGRAAIIVGGSLFYLKSLFFPPSSVRGDQGSVPAEVHALSVEKRWQKLYEIDPQRAVQIHCHDSYRVTRALAIWYESGQKPSSLIPTFSLPFAAEIIFLSWPMEVLYERIKKRTEMMIRQMGWIEEVEALMSDSQWRHLVESKGFIGYNLIAHWIESGKKIELMSDLIDAIIQETRRYAKRQMTFWRSFSRQLEAEGHKQCLVREISF